MLDPLTIFIAGAAVNLLWLLAAGLRTRNAARRWFARAVALLFICAQTTWLAATAWAFPPGARLHLLAVDVAGLLWHLAIAPGTLLLATLLGAVSVARALVTRRDATG